HVAIYLAHDLCQYTLVNIGKHFGGRKHATILHSIEVIEEKIKEDKSFYDQISQLKKTILEQS
ncbi:helix-turn-helix domain-containing protein, partial [Lancefieldella parvula]